jgi:hypothetical protein
MHRPLVLLAVGAVILGGLAAGTAPATVAREPLTDVGSAAGVTFAPLSFAPGIALPSPSDLVIERFALDPGASFSFTADTPQVGVILMELGTLTVQVDGPVSVSRGKLMTQIDPAQQTFADLSAATEQMRAGKSVRLKTGDAAFIPINAVGELRNEGEAPAVGLVFVAMEPASRPAETTP